MGKIVSIPEIDAQSRLSDTLASLFRRIAAQCQLLGLEGVDVRLAPAEESPSAASGVEPAPEPTIVSPAAAFAKDAPPSEVDKSAAKVDDAWLRMMESMPHFVIGLDSAGRCVLSNAAFQDFLGGIDDLEDEQSFKDLVVSLGEQEQVSLSDILQQADATGMWDGNLVLGRRKSKRLVVHANFFRFDPPLGGELVYAAILLDISRRTQLEQDALQNEVMRSIGMLAGGVAHNLNNLLVGVMGYASLLKPHTKSNKKMEKYVTMIENSSAKAAELTRQLLSFSQRGESRPSHFEINDAIKIAISLVRKLLRGNIEIEVAFTEQAALIHADPAHMEHIILRLCVNAGEAMPKGGSLRVAARTVTLAEEFVAKYAEAEAGTYVRLTVSDTGHGIPPDKINDIFHPFFTTREFTHRGLGLSSVYGLVQRYKGIITVDSEVDKGTTVDVYLPRFIPEENAEEHEAPPTIEESKRTLLIVDDQQTVLDFFASVLEHEPYELLFARDGQEALEIFKRSPQEIDLVFMDMVMPLKNGMETYYELIKIRPELKVIFASGFHLDDNLSRLIDKGKVGFLRKPFNIQQFLDTLHAALN